MYDLQTGRARGRDWLHVTSRWLRACVGTAVACLHIIGTRVGNVIAYFQHSCMRRRRYKQNMKFPESIKECHFPSSPFQALIQHYTCLCSRCFATVLLIVCYPFHALVYGSSCSARRVSFH